MNANLFSINTAKKKLEAKETFTAVFGATK